MQFVKCNKALYHHDIHFCDIYFQALKIQTNVTYKFVNKIQPYMVVIKKIYVGIFRLRRYMVGWGAVGKVAMGLSRNSFDNEQNAIVLHACYKE